MLACVLRSLLDNERKATQPARPRAGSMPEMPRAREHHGDAVIVGGLDHLLVAHRTAGLDHGGRSPLDRVQKAAREAKEGNSSTDGGLCEAGGDARAVAGGAG